MAHRRAVRVISYEGIDSWIVGVVDKSVVQPDKPLFSRNGTIKILHQIELKDGEKLKLDIEAVPDKP